MPSQADLAKIHIAKKELALTDEAYRDMLHLHFQVASAKDLNPRQVVVLLNQFRARGWKPKKGAVVKHGRADQRRKDNNFIEIKPGPASRQQRKVLAMWAALGYDVAKLHARCKKQFDIERFEWVTEYEQLHVLITDLEHRQNGARTDG